MMIDPSVVQVMIFVCLNFALLFTSSNCSTFFHHSKRWFDQIPLIVLLSCSQIILTEIILGAFHQLTVRNLLIVHTILAVISFFLKCRNIHPVHNPWDPFSFFLNDPIERHGSVILTVFFSLLFLAQGIRFLFTPPSHWDDLNYHLRFPVEWIQSGTLDNPIVPFGDLAPSYYPMNTELLHFWVMAPLKSDIIARILQHLFLGVGAIVFYGILHHIGMRRLPSIILTSSFFSMPYLMTQGFGFPVNGQTVSHDIMTLTLFLIWLYLLLYTLKSPSTPRFILAGIAAGVYIGTKYISMIFGIPLVICILLHNLISQRTIREKILCTGCFLIPMVLWGGPFYLRNWISTGNPLFPARITLFGETWFPGLYTAAQYQSRSVHNLFSWKEFLIHPAFGIGIVLIIIIGYASAVITTIASNRGFKKSPSSTSGNPSLFLLLLPLITFCLYYFLFPERNYRFLFIPLACAMITLGIITTQRLQNELLCLLVAFMVVTTRRTIQIDTYPVFCSLGSSQYTQPVLENRYAPGWRFLEEYTAIHPETRRIAYAGLNIPYPLYGREFQNRVVYVPVNNTGTMAHEYQNQSYRTPGDPYIWLDNMMEYDIRLLVCHTQLHQNRPTGFPEEDHWASIFSEYFHLIYHDEHTHIYGVGSGWRRIAGNDGTWSSPIMDESSGRFPYPIWTSCRPEGIVPGGMFDQITIWEIPAGLKSHRLRFHYFISGIADIDRLYPEPDRTRQVIHRMVINIPENGLPGEYSLSVRVLDQTTDDQWEYSLGVVVLLPVDSIPPLAAPEIISPEDGAIILRTTEFLWKPIPGALGYVVELTDPSGHTGRNRVFENNLALYLSPDTILAFQQGVYRWRVAAWEDSGMIGSFGVEKHFRIECDSSEHRPDP